MLMSFGNLTDYKPRDIVSNKTFDIVNGTYSLKSDTNSDISIATGFAPPNSSSEVSLSVNDYLSHFANKNYGNTVMGGYSLFNRITSAANTTMGWYSMHNNTTGSGNSTNGWFSLYNNVKGNANVAMGVGSAYTNDGDNNVFIGANSGYKNVGNENTFIGSDSGYNSTKNGNTFLGYKSGYNNNDVNNTFLGYQSGYSNTGKDNIFIGNKSGYSNTGNNNIFIGSNNEYIINDINNLVNIGDSAINLIRCATYSITTQADKRDKKYISSLEYGFDFLDKLNPVMFTWDRRDSKKNNIKSCGLIAQEVKLVLDGLPDSNATLHLLNESDPNNLELAYGNLIPVLINSAKQYSSKIKDINIEIDKLKQRVSTLETQFTSLQSRVSSNESRIANIEQKLSAI